MAGSNRLHYAWIVAAVTFLALLVAAGIRASPGVLVVPLETEFGWSRATISFAVGVNIFLYGLIGPFAAASWTRFGVRRTMLGALALIALGVAATPLMQQSWQLILLWGVVVGSGAGVIANVLAATIATRWFTARARPGDRLARLGHGGRAARCSCRRSPPSRRASAGARWRWSVAAVALLRASRRRLPDAGSPGGRRSRTLWRAPPRTKTASASTAQPGARRVPRRSACEHARATSGCSRAASSSAGPRPTG